MVLGRLLVADFCEDVFVRSQPPIDPFAPDHNACVVTYVVLHPLEAVYGQLDNWSQRVIVSTKIIG